MIPASRSLVLARRAGVLARGAQRRNMGGHSGEGHHSHDVFDMSTPFNPYRGPRELLPGFYLLRYHYK